MTNIKPKLFAEFLINGRSACHTLHFSQDNKYIAASTWDRKVHVWDVEAHKPLWHKKQHKGPCYSAKISPSICHLASCGPVMAGRKPAGAEVLLWDLEAGKVINRVEFYDDPTVEAFDIEYSPSGRFVACALRGEEGGSLAVFDSNSGTILLSVVGRYQYAPDAMVFSPYDAFLAVFVDEHLEMWDTESWTLNYRKDAPGEVTHAEFYQDGQNLYAANRIRRVVSTFEAKSGDEKSTFLEKPGEFGLNIRQLQVASSELSAVYWPGYIIVVNLKTKAEIRQIDLPSFGDIEDDPITLSNDGTILADLLDGRRLRLWSIT
jgi:WD40 repeat protein